MPTHRLVEESCIFPAIEKAAVCLASGNQLQDLSAAIDNHQTAITAHPLLTIKEKLSSAPLLYAPIASLKELSPTAQAQTLLKPLYSLMTAKLHYKLLLTLPGDDTLDYESLHYQLSQTLNITLYKPTADFIDDALKLHQTLAENERLIIGGISLNANDERLLMTLNTTQFMSEASSEGTVPGMGGVFILFEANIPEAIEAKKSIIFKQKAAVSELKNFLLSQKIPPSNIKAQWRESPLTAETAKQHIKLEHALWQVEKGQTPSPQPKAHSPQSILGDLGPLNALLTLTLAQQQSKEQQLMTISWQALHVILHGVKSL